MVDLRRYNHNNYVFRFDTDLKEPYDTIYIMLNGRTLSDHYLIIEDDDSQYFYSKEIIDFTNKTHLQFPKNFSVYTFGIFTITQMIKTNKEKIDGYIIDSYEFSRHLLKQKLRGATNA